MMHPQYPYSYTFPPQHFQSPASSPCHVQYLTFSIFAGKEIEVNPILVSIAIGCAEKKTGPAKEGLPKFADFEKAYNSMVVQVSASYQGNVPR